MSFKKFVITSLSITLVYIASVALPALAEPSIPPLPPIDTYPDPVIPLMEPMPFPWETIEGIWQARISGQNIWFSFDVRSDADGRKFLHVVQVSPGSKIVAFEGNGFIDERTNAVRAGMVGNPGTYMLFIGLYKNDKVAGYPKIVTMLTARSFKSINQEFSVMIEKIEPSPIKLP